MTDFNNGAISEGTNIMVEALANPDKLRPKGQIWYYEKNNNYDLEKNFVEDFSRKLFVKNICKSILNMINYKVICLKAHSCVEKNANISLVKIRLLDTDPEIYSLRGNTLEEQVKRDVQEGLIPFFVSFLW